MDINDNYKDCEENVELQGDPMSLLCPETIVSKTMLIKNNQSTENEVLENGSSPQKSDKVLNGDDKSDDEESLEDEAATEEYIDEEMIDEFATTEKTIEEDANAPHHSSSDDEEQDLENESKMFIENENKPEDDCSLKFQIVNKYSDDELSLDGPEKPEEKSPILSRESDEGKKSSIVDSLLDKFRRSNSNSSGSDIRKPKRRKIDSEEDLLREVDSPVCLDQSSNPNQLPTPVVHNQKPERSAFVNNEGEYRQAIAKRRALSHESTSDKSISETNSNASLTIVQPKTFNRLNIRTSVGQMINRNSINYRMVEQESKIFKQVNKTPRDYLYCDSLMCEDIPINTGPWKALTWLRTRPNHYHQLSVKVDGELFKIKGSRGNHLMKFLNEQSSKPFPKYRKFTKKWRFTSQVRRREFENLLNCPKIRKFVLHDGSGDYKRLDTKSMDNRLESIKPGPLSKKIEVINSNLKGAKSDEDEAFLGAFAKFNMPDIRLEVNLDSKAPLDPIAKTYLKEILPHRDLEENWCEFALTALAKKEKDNKDRNTFEFTIPYEKNVKSILVREINRSAEDTELLRVPLDDSDGSDDEMEWTFAKDYDKDDPIECEVVDIIKDLTNSVFINLNDNLFTKDDDIDRTPSESSPTKSQEAMKALSTMPRPTKSKRTIMELKRLNANVFKADSFNDEQDMRRRATAHLGREERELRPTVIITESNAVLLSNQDKEPRRIKRAPKKFEDYHNSMSKLDEESDKEEPAAKRPKLKSNDDDDLFKARVKTNLSVTEQNLIRNEVTKMMLAKVELQRLKLPEVSVFCMLHGFYKCTCIRSSFGPKLLPSVPQMRRFPISKPISLPEKPVIAPNHKFTEPQARKLPFKTLNSGITRRNSVQPQSGASLLKAKETIIRPTTSTVTLPAMSRVIRPTTSSVVQPTKTQVIQSRPKEATIDTGCNRCKTRATCTKAILKTSHGVPKVEIQNLCDLISGGYGPIYINFYNDVTMRLHSVLRSMMNNCCAIVYYDQKAFLVDKLKVNIRSFDFSEILKTFKVPIFILQAKEISHGPPPAVYGERPLFRYGVETVTKIDDNCIVKDISQIIESILCNVRKKVEIKVGREQNGLINANTPPFSPTPPPSNVKVQPRSYGESSMKDFNKHFALRMQKLVEIISGNTLGVHPSNEMVNKFYIYQWRLLLRSFEEDLIQIWQATIEGESGTGYQLLVLTDSNEKPIVEHVKSENVINIRKLSLSDKITELTRMILLRVEKANLKNMTILMYGCKGYMRICGILNSKEEFINGFKERPFRATHPQISEKLKRVFSIWQESRNIGRPKDVDYGATGNRNTVSPWRKANEETARPELAKRRTINSAAEKINIKEEKDVPKLLMQPPKVFIKPRQLEVTKGTKSKKSDFKWYLFNITNDFSDIYIQSWSRYLSYKVIMEAVERAKLQEQAVALIPSSQNTIEVMNWPRIFALPSAPLKFKDHETMTSNFLIFGPYTRNSAPNLLLMQNVNGKLMLRDEFEKRNNIKRQTRTRCLWIYANTLKCIQNADPDAIRLMWGPSDKRGEELKK